jgi:cytochrome c-type biogenesis protein
MAFLKRFRRHLELVEKVMGAFLVITGVMFLTGSIQRISVWLIETFPGLANVG